MEHSWLEWKYSTEMRNTQHMQNNVHIHHGALWLLLICTLEIFLLTTTVAAAASATATTTFSFFIQLTFFSDTSEGWEEND